MTGTKSTTETTTISHLNYLDCSDCIHKCSGELMGFDYCSKADREFFAEEDYERCAMFEEKNFTFVDDLPQPDEDELPFGT